MSLKKFLYNRIKDLLPDNLLFYKGNKNSKQVALTFDDGPCPENTEKILQILRAHNIKATFFMNGKSIENHKQIALNVVNEGHEIGNHLYNHKPVTNLTYKELDREVVGWEKVINEIIPLSNFPQLLRPPYGRLDLKTMWYTWKNGWTMVLWSIDTQDLEAKSLQDNIKILESIQIVEGDIILLHEDSNHAEGLLEWIIQEVIKCGYKFCKVSELIR